MLAAIPSLFALAVPFLPAKGPAELQGAWKLVALEGNGQTLEMRTHPRLVIVGDVVLYGGRPLARLTADPAAGPKLLDLRFRPDRVYEGVYTVEKDTLKVCVNKRSSGVKDRPNGLSTEGQADWRLMVFERVPASEAGLPEAGFVGIQLRMDAERGVTIDAAIDKSPAQAAGLKKDDVLVRIAGRDVTTLLGAVDAVRATKPGGKLELRVRRGADEQDLTVRVGLVPFEALAELD
jgi:uncharacterized protein (TIGR03067 family)